MIRALHTLRALLAATALSGLLGGCAVIAVADAAVSVTAGVVGLAADAAIGTARVAGRVVGAAADAALPAPVPTKP